MATVLLSAAGAAIGGSIGGTFAGVSSVAIGRLVGATVGRAIDQRIMGSGSQVVETGKVDRFRITGAAEGNAIAQVYGRMRVGGQVIWASQFQETVTRSGGGKGAPSQPETAQHSYTVSVAIALCEGEITRVGRIWADGVEIAPTELNMRSYSGSIDQLPDPKIEAIEGQGQTPAYRGTAYVVFEDLALAQFGNRLPQFSFEVVRPSQQDIEQDPNDPVWATQGVALMPGTGEYALATSPVYYESGLGSSQSANENAPSGKTDFVTSMDALQDELPNCGSVSLVVSWFGNDLRCNQCQIKPKVERADTDGTTMSWMVAGVSRSDAEQIVMVDDRPIYGGTPTDQSVIEAITHMQAQGKDVMFYPFVLMEQLENNGLANPWNDAVDQPALPWRGRITLEKAPGQVGSSDLTSAAETEVAAFFGSAAAVDFQVSGTEVTYSGPAQWGYRRFVLHYAALCKAAGGVSAFCIGSEMRGLTQIRGASGQFEAVEALRQLAADVRAILGSETKIGYAADWSEYSGYQPQDGSADKYFHLDPLWSDDNIDFVGIDNYMPLSDWRDTDDHSDAAWQSIYNLDYLSANVAGGEGYDWYYHSQEARESQIRTLIEDGANNEPWVYRYKDIANWWANSHHDRVAGERQATPSSWVPQSKPIWFTELGCAAIDKGTNQPNKFLDAKSSESSLPLYSIGLRDDFIQQQYLRAMFSYWGDEAHNPNSIEYGGPMVDMSHAHVWAWDARPFPSFPNNRDLWSDGANYARGHWLNGRTSARSLASVVEEICKRAGVQSYDTRRLYGVVRGYVVSSVSDARSALQPLMLQFGFDAIEREGILHFVMRGSQAPTVIDVERIAVSGDLDGIVEKSRTADAETAGRVRFNFVQADSDFEVVAEEAILADEATHAVSSTELPLSLTRTEGRQTAEKWLNEARISREGVRFALPPSMLHVGAGDVVSLVSDTGQSDLYRVDRVEQSHAQLLEAVRIEPDVYSPADFEDAEVSLKPFVPPVPVYPAFLDLPLMTGDEVPHAPHLAITASPWPGSVAVYHATTDENYSLNQLVTSRATIGVTENPLKAASVGLMDHGHALQVKLTSGALESLSDDAFLAGGNLAAIGDGTSDNWEVFQFKTAELIDVDTYLLSGRLRGQLGSEVLQSHTWDVGSLFVVLDANVGQIDLNSSARDIARHYRIGPAKRGYSDPSYVHRVEAFRGIGLRPYAPCHIKAVSSGAQLDVTWVRRTRIDGDSWNAPEVPLGEETETYAIRVLKDGSILREATSSAPSWSYLAADQIEDGLSGAFEISVAQVSGRFGAGPFSSVELSI